MLAVLKDRSAVSRTAKAPPTTRPAKPARAIFLLAGATMALTAWLGLASIAFSSEPDRINDAFAPFTGQNEVSHRESQEQPPLATASEAIAMKDRFTSAFAPFIKKAIKTVMFRPPRPDGPAKPLATGPLAGKPLRYLIGARKAGSGSDDAVTVVSYDTDKPTEHGISIGYCNLFDETNSGDYGPYLEESDTAAKYDEGQIDPNGPGWTRIFGSSSSVGASRASNTLSSTMQMLTRSVT